MTTATKKAVDAPKKLKTVELVEHSFDQHGLTLEEEDGQPILRHVKILGSVSQNGRFYTPEAKSAALPLYESVKVNLDHPDNPQKTRGIRDRFGKLVHIRIENGDLYGDLLFNPFHELAESIKWYAKNMPDCLGLSHNAVGQGDEQDGKFIVRKIAKLRSVDLVADPATTVTLFESKQEEESIETIASVEAPVEQQVTEAKKGTSTDSPDAKAKTGTNETPRDKSPTPPAKEIPGPNDTVPTFGSIAQGPATEDGWQNFDLEVGRLVRKLVQNKELSKEQKRKSILAALRFEEERADTTAAVTEAVKPEVTQGATTVAETPPVKPALQPKELLESFLADSRKQREEMAAKITVYEQQSTKQSNIKKAQVLLQEAKLPTEAITAYFLEKLATATDEKEMRDLIEDRKLLINPGQVNLTESRPANGSAPIPASTTKQKREYKDTDVASILGGGRSLVAGIESFN